MKQQKVAGIGNMDNERREDGGRANGGNGSGEGIHSVQHVTEDLQARAETQKDRAADTADHAADAARRAAQNLGGQEAWMAGLIEQGADKLADLAQTLRTNDLRTLLTRVEEFAHTQPVLFTGAAMALGFAMTRAIGMAQRSSAQAAPEAQSFSRPDERGRYDH